MSIYVSTQILTFIFILTQPRNTFCSYGYVIWPENLVNYTNVLMALKVAVLISTTPVADLSK